MKVLLLTRAGAHGTTTKKTVQAESLRVGRNASCEIHLADPRVALEQGVIVNREGLVYVEGEGGGGQQGSQSTRLEVGKPFEVGPYRLQLQAAPAGYEAAILIELVRPLEASTSDLAARSARRTLSSVGLSKRWPAWLALLLILGLFLAWPAARVLDLPWRGSTYLAAFGDRTWNPGPVMLAHQPIAQKCDACHQVAFEQVPDRACLECHSTIGHHVGPQMNPAAMFEGARCASCHRDHKGTKPTHRDDDTSCVACHKDIRAHAKDTQDANVSDFAREHPDFRLSLPTDKGIRRVRLEGKLTEHSNLIFPHAVHLDPKGVRSPVQGRMRLECKSCHAADASGRSFQPVSMPKHCQECHTLQFEPAVTTREAPHGKPAEVLTMVEEFYANLALQGVRDSFQKAFGVPGEGLLRRAGQPDEGQRRDALAMARRKAKQVGEEIFEVRVCKTCHAVAKDGSGWVVPPVRAVHTWMPQARFDHKPHSHVACADCHDVAKSEKATDVAMPGIETCRACHGGSTPVEAKVTSNCMLCHGFHDPRHPWDPKFQPRGGARVAEGRPDAR